MAIRKHPTKGQNWWILVISQGKGKKQLTYTVQCTKAEALAIEADLRGTTLESKDQRISEILSRFFDWYSLDRSTRTVSDCKSTLPHLLAVLGDKHLSMLRQFDYDRYKAQRIAACVSKKTINIELGYLRAVLTYARDQLHLLPGDLPKLYTKKQTAPPPVTPLTPDETARLLAQLQGDKKTIVMLYAWCGLRRNEALLLQRKHIDLQAGLINVTGKGGKSRVVPIIGVELLHRLKTACSHHPKNRRGKQIDPADKIRPKQQNEYLFICARTKQPYLDIKKALKAAAARAGISKDVGNHLLRHSAATAAISAGVDVRSLQAMIGHSDIRMTERYTHMAADMMHSAGGKLAKLHEAAKQGSERSEKSKGKNSNIYQLFKK